MEQWWISSRDWQVRARIISDNDALKIQDKIDQLFEDADSLDWKGLFEKDSSRTLHNSIKQSYYVSDVEFWRRYKEYVDTEIDEVVQIRRDYRRILWRFREINAERIERGDFAINILQVIEDFYNSHAAHDVSNLRKYFENKQEFDNIYEHVTKEVDFAQPPTMDELAQHVGELNTVKVLSPQPLPRSAAKTSLLDQLVRKEPENEEEGLEIAKEIGVMGEALDVLWNWGSRDGNDEEMSLTERERELVEDVQSRFQEMVRRKQQMDISGRTVRKVVSVKLAQAELFELICRRDFTLNLKRIAQKQRGSSHIKDPRIRALFEKLKRNVYQNSCKQLQEFADKWGLTIWVNKDEFDGAQIMSNCVNALRERLELSTGKKHSLDVKAEYLEHKLEEMGNTFMFEGEWQKQAVSLEMLNEFEDLLLSLRRMFTDEAVLKKLLRNQNSIDRDVKIKMEGLFRRKKTVEDLEQMRRNLQKAAEDESEDLVEEPIFAKYKFQLEEAREKQRLEDNLLNLKIFVFNLKVNEQKNKKILSELPKRINQIKNDLQNNLKKLKQQPKTKTSERQICELEQLIQISKTKNGESLLLHLNSHPDLQSKLNEKNWFKTFNQFIQERVHEKNLNENVQDSDLRTQHEIDKIQEIGLRAYLVYEIGLEKFLGTDSYVSLRERVADQIKEEPIETEAPEQEFADDWQMAGAIIGELIGENVVNAERDAVSGTVEEGRRPRESRSLNRELKLVGMKLRLIDEEIKDVQEEEQTRYFNKVIRVEQELKNLRERGHEPSRREVLQMISDWDLEERNLKTQMDNIFNDGDGVFKYYFKQKQRRYVEAKARVLIDYLLRFDPEFRRMYLRTKSIEEIGSRVETGIRSALENKEFLNNFDILALEPEFFGIDKKSIMLGAIEKAIQKQLPADLFDSKHVMVNDGLESFVSESILTLCQQVEQRLITDEIEERSLRRTTKIAELDYVRNLKQWIHREQETPAILTEGAPRGPRNDREGVENIVEQPLLLGKLVREQGHLTQEDLVEALRNPTFENKERVSDLLLSSLRKFNDLPENDPYYLELVGALFEAKLATMDATETQNSPEMLTMAEEIEKKGFSLENPTVNVDMSNLDPLHPPDLAAFDRTPDVSKINECLLSLVTQFDLSELGITSSFVSTLEQFMQVLHRRQTDKEQDAVNLQIVTGRAKGTSLDKNPDPRNIDGYFPRDLRLLDRRDTTNMMAEQLAITEANVRHYRDQTGARMDPLTGHLVKQKVYRVDPTKGVITREEFMLTNEGVFNVDEESEEQDEINDLMYR